MEANTAFVRLTVSTGITLVDIIIANYLQKAGKQQRRSAAVFADTNLKVFVSFSNISYLFLRYLSLAYFVQQTSTFVSADVRFKHIIFRQN